MSDYPLLRASLDTRYADLPLPELQKLVRGIYGPEVDAEDVEGLFDDFGRGLQHVAKGVGQFAQQAAPMLAKALPAIGQGASSGAAFGPWGALIGAGAGLASGLLGQSSNPTARRIGGAIHGAGSLVSTVRGGGIGGGLGSLSSVASGALGTTSAGRSVLGSLQTARGGDANGGANGGGDHGATGGVNMLMGLLSRPELLQSVTAAMMGSAGRQSVLVGQQPVAVSQMLAALSNIAGRAAHEAAEFDEGAAETPEYASSAAEVLGIDPEDAEGRADALLAVLALTPSLWMNHGPATTIQINANDPYFPAGEMISSEAEHGYLEAWVSEDLVGEDLVGEDTSEAWPEDWNEDADIFREFDETVRV
ncbi:hypothetical protein [Sphingomonas sp. R86521]|uniref:hypothetical protein n=1 Tax=Sphingomonas sp. R86521 TaxID=3093860 RepID=UPI0036D257FC